MKFLFIGAHPDDNCLHCGGLMSRINRWGGEFHCRIMTCFDEDRAANLRSAMDFIRPETFEVYPFLASYLEDHKRKLRRTLLKIRSEVKPDVVFTHNLDSSSLDHALLAKEIRKLYRWENMFGYQGLKDEGGFTPMVFVKLEEEDVLTKIELLKHFRLESQYQDFLNPDVIKSHARVMGVKCGETYAEGFNIVRMKL